LRPFGDLSSRAGNPQFTFSTETVTVPAEGKASVDVTIQADASLVPAGLGQPNGDPFLATTSGTVVFLPASPERPLLRVPFSTVVRGTSNISSTPTAVDVADQVTITCVPGGGTTGAVDALAWGLSDPSGDTTGTDLINRRVRGPRRRRGLPAQHRQPAVEPDGQRMGRGTRHR
jgi:hypothetical protein